ncbi:MAG: LysR family transcriptional regulator [Clostridiaceae bacterium]
MSIDLNLYRVFFMVARYRNISHAAEELYISQPAVSKSIKTLENRLKIKLFMRNPKGVSLTKEGEILLKYIENAFNEISSGEDMLDKLKAKEIGTINLGVSTVLGKNYLIPRLKKFIIKYPDFKIQINNKHSEDEIELIKEDKLELAIVCDPILDDMIELIKLEEARDIFVASKSYLEKNHITTAKDSFAKGSFMLLENNNGTRKHIDNYFYNQGLSIVPEIEASNMDFLIECSKIGLGITSVLRSFVQKDLRDGTLVEIPLDAPIPSRYIGMAYKKNSSLSIASEALISFLKSAVSVEIREKL